MDLSFFSHLALFIQSLETTGRPKLNLATSHPKLLLDGHDASSDKCSPSSPSHPNILLSLILTSSFSCSHFAAFLPVQGMVCVLMHTQSWWM